MTAAVVARPVASIVREAPRHRVTGLLPGRVAAAVAIAAVLVAQSVNLVGAPNIKDDEGTYIAQAQAVLHLGALAPYTYFYDHPPGGWIQIAGWLALTGEGSGFGGAIVDGRIFMVVVQAVSMLLVIAIGRRVTGSVWAGILAAVLFGLSPTAFLFHRRVLLDNLATLWMLASLALLLARRATLSKVVLAALALGIAVWSKEIAITALPAGGLLAWRRSPRESRRFAAAAWLTVAGGVVSAYALMAALKGEFFPYGTQLGGSHPHVSLLCTLEWQSGRGSDGGLLQQHSGFWNAVSVWTGQDPVLVAGGSAAALIALVAFRRNAGLSAIAMIVLTVWVFLGRGGITLEFYLVPAVPFLALALVCTAWALGRAIVPWRRTRIAAAATGAVLAVAAACTGLVTGPNLQLWTTHPATGQAQAIAWVQQHLPHDSRILMDMDMFPALHDPQGGQGAPFPSAEYYWRAAEDPAVLRRVFRDRWQDVDYVIADPQLLADTASQGFPIVRGALEHATPVATFDTGYRVQVLRVSPTATASTFALHPGTAVTPASCMTQG